MRRKFPLIVPTTIVAAILFGAIVFAFSRFGVMEEIGRQAGRAFRPRGHENVYVILKAMKQNIEFWQVVRAGISVAATEFDVQPKIVGPDMEKDVDQEIRIMAEVIQKKPDAILLAASDYNRLVPLAEKAAAEGVTIVTLDSALNSTVPVSFVATDNVAAGRKAGAEIDRIVPADKPIAIVSHIQGVATAIDREKGVRDAMQFDGRKEPIATIYTEDDPDITYRLARKLLSDYPDLGGIVALNEVTTLGVSRALKDAGAAGRVRLVGFDNSQEEIQDLEKGVLDALVVQRPFNMGYIGIKTLVLAMRGDRVPKEILTESVLVRANDMFTPENQKLLFPLLQKP